MVEEDAHTPEDVRTPEDEYIQMRSSRVYDYGVEFEPAAVLSTAGPEKGVC